jgi:hypothetical protein
MKILIKKNNHKINRRKADTNDERCLPAGRQEFFPAPYSGKLTADG